MDQEWDVSKDYGYLMGDNRRVASYVDILNTTNDEIFRSAKRGLISYKVKLPSGNYKLELLFSEHSEDAVGDRIFNIYAENEKIAADLDVVASAGFRSALTLQEELEITDGILDLFFEEVVDSALLCGIRIEFISTGLNTSDDDKLNDFQLLQNYPNPFNNETTVRFLSPEQSKYMFRIYDVNGEEIYNENLYAGIKGVNQFSWKGRDKVGNDVSSGIYIYVVENDLYRSVRKMVYLK